MTEHEPAKEAVEHLQKAALEVIAATRAFLDLAEELVADPAPLVEVSRLISGLAAKGRAAASAGERPPEHEPKVQHIRVS